MAVGRSLRILPKSLRCGDCLLLTAVVVTLMIVASMYFRSLYPNDSVARSSRGEAAAGQQAGVDDDIWPSGKMRQTGGKKQRQKRKPAEKIQAAIERLGLSPVPDTRPKTCAQRFADGKKGTNFGPQELARMLGTSKIGIVIVPSDSTFSSPRFKTTLVSLLATTAPLYQNLDIGLVTASTETAKHLRSSFDSINNPNKPLFRILEREDFFEKETMFKELLAIAAADFKSSDIVVFLTSGMECNIGWLEPLVEPLLEQSSNSPVIVSPIFSRQSGSAEGDRLLFNWRLAPKWTKLSKAPEDETELIQSLMFMPQAFAIKRSSDHFGRLFSFISQRNMADPTTFDAAMYFSRCLGVKVTSAPCARLTLPEGFTESEFDPFLKTPKETKQRLAATWLSEYRYKFEQILGKYPASLDNPAHCKTLSSVVGVKDETEIVQVPDEFQNRDGYKFFTSLAGTTFLPISGHMRAGVCPFPESPDMMFKHMLGGAIQSPNGMCLTAPKEHGYVDVTECRDEDPLQQWVFLQGGKLQSSSSKLCMMHATDPTNEKSTSPSSQVLMIADCATEDNNFYKFAFADNC